MKMEIMLLTNPNSATIGRRIPWTTNWNKLLGSPNSPDLKWKGHEVPWISSELESLKISANEILAMVKISTIYTTIDILATICTLILFNLIAIDAVVNIKTGS